MTTIGKYRHLSRCSSAAGHFVVLALDHRANLLDALNKHAAQPVTDAGFAAFKAQVIMALAGEATAVLTDPAYGIGAGVANGSLARAGLLAPIEVTNYDQHPSERDVDFIPHWSVGKIKRMGGDGIKLLLPYHPDAANADDKRAAVRRIVDECGAADIPFYLEPIPYALDRAAKLTSAEFRQLSVAMAREFSGMGVDVLKMQFPLDVTVDTDPATWRAACEELDAACSVPWTLLSGGVSYAVFEQQAAAACAAGASGVIVGRAVWNEAVTLDGAARADWLVTTGRERMRALAAVCAAQGRAWQARTGKPSVEMDWYVGYGE
jgi:tagatose 1,6-diphosphate aldolase